MNVIVLGAKGVLGSELAKQWQGQLPPEQLFLFDRDDLDVTNFPALDAKIAEIKPDLVFNCVAYNFVDEAETHPQAAQLLNAKVPEELAKLSAKYDFVLVHYSTGFVFSGEQQGYKEDDLPNPQSVYAKSKFAGEQAVQNNCQKYYIIRLNLLFGAEAVSGGAKKTFPQFVLEFAQDQLAKGQKEFNFIADEISTPTYSKDLAAASIELVQQKYAYGIYHLANSGSASWLDYAREVFTIKGLDIKLNPVSADAFNRAAKRPKNSVLLNTKFPPLRAWQQALKEFLNQQS